MAATAFTDCCNRREKACKTEESIYALRYEAHRYYNPLMRLLCRRILHRGYDSVLGKGIRYGEYNQSRKTGFNDWFF